MGRNIITFVLCMILMTSCTDNHSTTEENSTAETSLNGTALSKQENLLLNDNPCENTSAGLSSVYSDNLSEIIFEISPYTARLDEKRRSLAESVSENSDGVQLDICLKEQADYFDTENFTLEKILLTDLFFYDFDNDGSEELLTTLEFDSTPESNAFYSALCYADEDKAEIISHGFSRHRNTHIAFADGHPFIIIAETGMGHTEPPLLKAEKVFYFSENNFIPYSSADNIYISISESENRLFIFGGNVDTSLMQSKINSGLYTQTLSFDNGNLTVETESES